MRNLETCGNEKYMMKRTVALAMICGVIVCLLSLIAVSMNDQAFLNAIIVFAVVIIALVNLVQVYIYKITPAVNDYHQFRYIIFAFRTYLIYNVVLCKNKKCCECSMFHIKYVCMHA